MSLSETEIQALKDNHDIVSVIGASLELKKEGSGFKACCPFHDESTPSFNVNPNQQIFKCFGCDAKGDVIEWVMKYHGKSFTEAVEYLGAEPATENKPRPKKKKAEPVQVIKLTIPAAKDHYTVDVIQGMADYIFKEKPKQLIKSWKYLDENGLVELVACRFEDDEGKKSVLSFYWNGKTIKMSGYPVLLYNRDRLKNEPEKDVLIVYGEKCAEIADSLGFIGVTWNGGEKKVNDVDFGPLMNRTVYQWADDDNKKYMENHARAGQRLPQNEQPGTITCKAVQKAIPHVQTVDFIEELREIEPDGADIAEAIEYFKGDTDAVTQHIYTTAKRQDKKTDKKSAPEKPSAPEAEIDTSTFPFTVLGIANDGKAYFIGINDRLWAFDTTTLSKNKLMNLAGIDWWWATYGKSKDDFDQAVSDLIHVSTITDFDQSRMRGRGAWAEPDGRICYYDGKKITGEYDKSRVFLRRPRKDIGINNNPATAEQRREIFNICQELTFASLADIARTLGWAAISPFAGALRWRPCIFITAGSGTGKSTILDLVINKISSAEEFTGIDTTAAGIRQHVGSDSCAITIDEAEAKDKKSKQNRSEIFGIIRQSTSNNAPKAAKGTQDGRGVHYEMKSMFALNAINPVIDGEADEKRSVRISLVKATEDRKSWIAKERRIKEIINPETCKGIRAYTWENLENIFKLTERVAEFAQIETDIDNRTAYADSLLLAAFLVVFFDQKEPSGKYLSEMVKTIYSGHQAEEPRNETEEMLDLLLDQTVRDGSEEFTIRELLHAIQHSEVGSSDDGGETRIFSKSRARRLAGMHGIGCDPEYNIAIAKKHHKVASVLDSGYGYHHQLVRHPLLVDSGKNVGLGSAAKTQNCVLIGGGEE